MKSAEISVDKGQSELVRRSQLAELNRLLVIGHRTLDVAFAFVDEAAVAVGESEFWVEINCLVVIGRAAAQGVDAGIRECLYQGGQLGYRRHLCVDAVDGALRCAGCGEYAHDGRKVETGDDLGD